VRGRVEDPDGSLAAGGRGLVSIETSWLRWHFVEARLERDGSFELKGVPGEPVRLSVVVHAPALVDGRPKAKGVTVDLDPRSLLAGDAGTLKLGPLERFS
jgi:hypothetical protein